MRGSNAYLKSTVTRGTVFNHSVRIILNLRERSKVDATGTVKKKKVSGCNYINYVLIVHADIVSSRYFRLAGVRPALPRPDEELVGGARGYLPRGGGCAEWLNKALASPNYAYVTV